MAASPLVVLDTNVIVGAVIGRPDTEDGRVVRAAVTGEAQLALSDAFLTELVRVMLYPKVESRIGSPGRAFAIATDLTSLGIMFRPRRFSWPGLRDQKDWWVLDLAYESGADCVVTQDQDLLQDAPPLGFEVRTPPDFLRELSSWSR